MFRPCLYYVDPSVMTYTVQALAAVAVAFSAIAGVAFRRTRKFFFRLLGVDEHAGRVHEDSVSFAENDTLAAAEARARELRSLLDGVAGNAVDDAAASWPIRLLRCFGAAAFLTFSVFVVAPLEIISASSADLVFSALDVAPPLCIAAVVAALVLALVLSLFTGKLHSCCVVGTLALGVAAWLQALLLNRGLPIADGNPVDWSNFDKITVVSLIFWVFIIGAAIGFTLWFPKRTRALATALAVALVLIQAAGLVSAMSSSDGTMSEADHVYCTERGLFDVSSKSNVIVFIIDASDYNVVSDTLEQYPNLLDCMKGFTWFIDASGSMIPTRYALPALLTGIHPDNTDETFKDFVADWYSSSSFMQQLNDTGYGVGVYSPNATWSSEITERFEDWTINYRSITNATSEQMDTMGTVLVCARCGLYRSLPWALKRFAWYYTDELNSRMVKSESELRGDVPFLIDDPLFASKLREYGLSLNDEQRGSFKLIHLLGSHHPYFMDCNGNDMRPGWTSIEEQTVGTFSILNSYFEELRRLGCYDEATIIVTADHGIWNPISEYLAVEVNPVLFVKPRQNAEQAREALVRSRVPVSHWDLQATILEAMGAQDEVVNLYGSTVWNAPEQRKRLFYWLNSMNWDGDIIEYEIDGDSRDISTWHPTGRRWTEIV